MQYSHSAVPSYRNRPRWFGFVSATSADGYRSSAFIMCTQSTYQASVQAEQLRIIEAATYTIFTLNFIELQESPRMVWIHFSYFG